MLNVMHGKILYNTSLKWKLLRVAKYQRLYYYLLVTLDTDSELDSKNEEDDL
jgi:hypothetical protein